MLYVAGEHPAHRWLLHIPEPEAALVYAVWMLAFVSLLCLVHRGV